MNQVNVSFILKKFSENSLPAKLFSMAAMLAKKRREETGNEGNKFSKRGY